MAKPLFTITVTVYRSRGDLPRFLSELDKFARAESRFDLQAVFVVDGCPENSHALLASELPRVRSYRWKLIDLTRNFGATYAFRCALRHADGDYVAPIPPDLQDPLSLVGRCFDRLREGEIDLCLGVRLQRGDPWPSRFFSSLYWWLFQKLARFEIPRGGVDFFAATREFVDKLSPITDPTSFFLGHVLRLPARRAEIEYVKAPRRIGKSSWSWRKKLRYARDGIMFRPPPEKKFPGLPYEVSGILRSDPVQ